MKGNHDDGNHNRDAETNNNSRNNLRRNIGYSYMDKGSNQKNKLPQAFHSDSLRPRDFSRSDHRTLRIATGSACRQCAARCVSWDQHFGNPISRWFVCACIGMLLPFRKNSNLSHLANSSLHFSILEYRTRFWLGCLLHHQWSRKTSNCFRLSYRYGYSFGQILLRLDLPFWVIHGFDYTSPKNLEEEILEAF